LDAEEREVLGVPGLLRALARRDSKGDAATVTVTNLADRELVLGSTALAPGADHSFGVGDEAAPVLQGGVDGETVVTLQFASQADAIVGQALVDSDIRGEPFSSSVLAFEQARVALIHVEDVFRVDALFAPDSVRFPVRNFGYPAIKFEFEGYPRELDAQGDSEVHARLGLIPDHHEFTFRLGNPGERAKIKVHLLLASVRFQDTGTVRITTQARVRRIDP
jgi:hypothetical protein